VGHRDDAWLPLKEITTICTDDGRMRWAGWFTVGMVAAYYVDLNYFGGTYGRAVESILGQLAHSFR
jgi:hypothetical protein